MKLSQVMSLGGGDWLVVWKSDQGDFRGIALSDLITTIQASLKAGRPPADSQYAAPAATGFSVTVGGQALGNDVHLILTPIADYAAGTIVLPLASGCVDKQEVTVTTTHAVTTLTISLNGALAIIGAPTTLAIGAFFKLCYDLTTLTWYRVG